MLRSEATTLLRLFLQNVGTEDAVVGNVNSDIKYKQLMPSISYLPWQGGEHIIFIGNKVIEYTF